MWAWVGQRAMGTQAVTLDTMGRTVDVGDVTLDLSAQVDVVPPTVALGPFQVADTTKDETATRLVELAVGTARSRPVLAFALHVGGLNALNDDDFVAAMNAADLVYADGGSVVWLGRRNGASRMGRAATTDIGWDVLHGVAARLGRTPRVALIGGRPGLAKRAAAALQAAGAAEPVLIVHGYHDAWEEHVDRVRDARPDVVLVGMGAPNEMVWAHEWAPRIGRGLVLTCGGWFGFLAGEERRAPRLIRRPGLEWMGRVAQQPWRLGPRYARGMMTTATLSLRTSRASSQARHR
jgi:N-acetylglucosaminyldiphosphoundecaprenol N-acetyl-beta-D-mannosaminyltransferase